MTARTRTIASCTLVLALLLGACRSMSLPRPEVAERARAIESLSGRLRVSLSGPGTRGRATVLFAFRRPDALRLEVPGPTGPRLTLLARDHRLLASFPHDRAYWEGEATAQALEVVLGVGLTPSEVMDLLVGVAPGSVRDYRASWGAGASLPRQVSARLADGARLSVVLEEAEVGGSFSPRVFEEPARAGFRPLGDHEVRSLWR
ncbi:MAG TPA: hypothetical protein VJU18_19740 [Vicinamibacteria bacterium]|nr:hypothetical protein [Vicinamibacteria bacterium]